MIIRKYMIVSLLVLIGAILANLSIEKLSFEFEMVNVGMAGAVIVVFITAIVAVAEIKSENVQEVKNNGRKTA